MMSFRAKREQERGIVDPKNEKAITSAPVPTLTCSEEDGIKMEGEVSVARAVCNTEAEKGGHVGSENFRGGQGVAG